MMVPDPADPCICCFRYYWEIQCTLIEHHFWTSEECKSRGNTLGTFGAIAEEPPLTLEKSPKETILGIQTNV